MSGLYHVFVLLICFTRLSSFVHMAANKLIIEKASVVQANKEYFSFADLYVDHYSNGKYELSGNFAIIQDIPNSTMVIGKIKNFIDHKYEVVGGSDGKNLCQFLRDEYHDWFPDEYLADQQWIRGCPIYKRNYWLRHFTPKDKIYPIVNLWTKSLSEITFYNDEELILHIKWYATLANRTEKLGRRLVLQYSNEIPKIGFSKVKSWT